MRTYRNNRQLKIASSGYSGSSERCGDSSQWAYLTESRFAAALSDGMGKGERAARESEKAVNSVIALLKAGMDAEMALQILNLLWTVSNRKELFPTMDLALLDFTNNELKIYKTGAAPTVVVRAPRCRPGHRETCRRKPYRYTADGRTLPERIEILTAPAMPMGVSECNEIPCISTIVMPGDLIIMMTDGVFDSGHVGFENRDGESVALGYSDKEPDWLRRLLNRIKSQNLQTICDLIIREAALNYGSREKDDMSVVVMRV